jgi:sugar lactone lactonase YvrE
VSTDKHSHEEHIMTKHTTAPPSLAFGACTGAIALALALSGADAQADTLKTVTGLAQPESAIIGPDGRIYVSEIGGFGKDGDGKVTAIGPDGQATPFASGMDDPKGLAAVRQMIYVADKTRIWKIDTKGMASVFVKADDFPQPPLFLNDLTVDRSGNLFVSDSGEVEKGGKGAIFKVTPAGKVSLVVSESQNPAIKSPNGLLFEPSGKLLVVDFASGDLLRLDVGKGTTEKIAEGFGGGDGLAHGAEELLYVSDWKNGRVWKLDMKSKGAKPEPYSQTFQAAADIALSKDGKFILVPDMKAGTLVWLPK